MSTIHNSSDILDKYLITDDFLAKQYEQVSAQHRALIKTAIAFHFSVHKIPQEEEHTIYHKKNAFCTHIHKKYVPYALFILEENFNSSATLLSALCPALLAGVENIYIFFLSSPTDTLATALELCGIENLYNLNSSSAVNHSGKTSSKTLNCDGFSIDNQCTVQNDIQIFMQHLYRQYAGTLGRIIILESAQIEHNSTQKDIINSSQNTTKPLFCSLAKAYNIPLYIHRTPIRIYPNQQKHRESIHQEKHGVHSTQEGSEILSAQHINNLTFAYGGSAHLLSSDCTEHTALDISFCSEQLAPQNYHLGMEVCAIHPDLSTDFFINTITHAHMIISSD